MTDERRTRLNRGISVHAGKREAQNPAESTLAAALVFLSLYRSTYLLIPFHFPLTIARPHASNVTHPIRSCPRLPSYLSHLSFIFCLPPTTCFSSTRALLYQVCSTKASTCIIFSSSFPVCTQSCLIVSRPHFRLSSLFVSAR
jgi:hypothetical protein